LLWRHTVRIQKAYRIDTKRTFSTEQEITSKGSVELNGSGGGLASGRGALATTTLDPTAIIQPVDRLDIVGIAHPRITEFEIVP
jgi:hypothetical protein